MLSQENLEKRLQYWQEILGLQNKNIRISYKNKQELDKIYQQSSLFAYGLIEFFPHPTIYLNEELDEEMIDLTIIHELLHLYFDPYDSVIVKILNYLPPKKQEIAQLLGKEAADTREILINELADIIFNLAAAKWKK